MPTPKPDTAAYTAEDLAMFDAIEQAFDAVPPGMSGPFDECAMLPEETTGDEGQKRQDDAARELLKIPEVQKRLGQPDTSKSFGDYETEDEQEAYREGWQQATEEREALRALLREAGAATAWMPDGWKQRAKELGV